MKILVTGGREFRDGPFVNRTLDELHVEHPITMLVEGGAPGADYLAQLWAKHNQVPIHTEEANWDRYRNHAGRVRNCKMLREHKHDLDAVLAFRGSTGTRHMVFISQGAGIPVIRSWEADSLSRFLATYKSYQPA